MFQEVLVPLDGSALATAALPTAAKVVQYHGGNLTLLSSVETDVMVPTGSPYEFAYAEREVDTEWEEARAHLKSMRGAYADAAPSIALERGKPAVQILDAIAEKAIDLLVMTSRGRTGIARWLLGSVTERVLQHATCPVLVMRDDTPITNMLVPLDGSELARQVLAPVVGLAEATGASITLLQVGDQLAKLENKSIEGEDMFEEGVMDEIVANYKEQLAAELNVVRDALDTFAPVNVMTAVGDPASKIMEVAETGAFDLIAMSTHGRGNVLRWIYGSVAEKVLRTTDRHMLIVRPSA